jgi:hypothetical protein
MRYLILTYYAKADGKMDETSAVSNSLRPRDIQTASVILDFKKLAVVKAHLNGTTVPKDFHKIVEYYMQHYENIIKRLFAENGYEVEFKQPEQTQPDPG